MTYVLHAVVGFVVGLVTAAAGFMAALGVSRRWHLWAWYLAYGIAGAIISVVIW